MAQTFKFDLVSPERVLLSAEAEQVVVPGAEGDFAVLPGHAPFISTLRPGVLDITSPAGHRRILVKAGFADVDPNYLTILAQEAFDVEELTPSRLADELRLAEAELGAAKTDEARMTAETLISELKRAAGRL